MCSDRRRVDLDLILTGQCNLACGYCYQTAPRSGPMQWDTVRAALDAALADAPDTLNLILNGGEPLLAPRLVRRTVDRIRAIAPASTNVSIALLTNGSLLDRSMLAVLLDHDVDIQLSVHPNGRADGARYLGDQLAQIAAWVPARGLTHLSLAMVVTPERVNGLAAVVRALIDLGFPNIYLVPPFTPQPAWTSQHLDRLRRETAAIVEHCADVYEMEGRVPVDALRSEREPSPRARDDIPICRAVSGSKFCVDPSGIAWACPCFATTLVDVPDCAQSVSSAFDLGNIHDRCFTHRLAGLSDSGRWPAAFSNRTTMYSGLKRCADCEYLDDCSICPAAICHAGDDPYRIPDHVCGFSMAMTEGAQQLHDLIGNEFVTLLESLAESLSATRS